MNVKGWCGATLVVVIAVWASVANGQSGGVWTNASLSVPRISAAASSGNLALFAGGMLANTYCSATVDIYDTARDSWTTSGLSAVRCGLSATSTLEGNLALFAGGIDDMAIPVSTVDIYNGTSRSWTVSSLSVSRYRMAATSVSGRYAMFAGGLQPYSMDGYFSAVDVFDAVSGVWTSTSLSQARANLAATSVDGMALFAGGTKHDRDQGVTVYLDTVDIYHVSNTSWTNASLSLPRAYLAATTVNGRAIFAGGEQAGEASDVVDIYHASNNSWTTAKLSHPRSGLVATTVGDLAFFAGSDGVWMTVVDIYNATSNTWTTDSLSVARPSLAATSVGGLALFAGGFDSTVVDIFQAVLPPPVLVSNTSSVGEVPVLQLNSNSSEVVLIPKDEQSALRAEKALAVSFNDVMVKEINIGNNNTVLRTAAATISRGWKQVIDVELSASSSFLLSTDLIATSNDTSSSTNASAAAARMEVQFYLFSDRSKTIDLGANMSLTVKPSFAKFSVRLFGWPFPDESDEKDTGLEMRIKVTPRFTGFTRQVSDAEPGVTTLVLAGQYRDDGSASANGAIRLVDTVEIDGETMTRGAGVQFDMDVARSELVLRFARFNSSLFYDPDLGVLFGPNGRTSSGDSANVAMIVGVSVAAVVCAVAIVIAAVVGLWMTRRRRQRRTVHFTRARELGLGV